MNIWHNPTTRASCTSGERLKYHLTEYGLTVNQICCFQYNLCDAASPQRLFLTNVCCRPMVEARTLGPRPSQKRPSARHIFFIFKFFFLYFACFIGKKSWGENNDHRKMLTLVLTNVLILLLAPLQINKREMSEHSNRFLWFRLQ